MGVLPIHHSFPSSVDDLCVQLGANAVGFWAGEMTCDRLTEVGPSGDVQIDTKLDTLPPVQVDNTAAGLFVEQDANTFLRFEVMTLNQTYRVVAHKVIAGVGTDHIVACDNLTLSAPVYLRVQRVDNAWTLSYSTDGATFTSCGTFTQALTVNTIGLHADNQASDLTAFTSVSFDYFHVATADAPNPVFTYVYDVNAALPNVLNDGTFKYVYGLGLAYAVDSQGTVQVDHTDGLGSARAITDGSGTVIETYQTDPFGVPTASQGTISQPFQYTGQQ